MLTVVEKIKLIAQASFEQQQRQRVMILSPGCIEILNTLEIW